MSQQEEPSTPSSAEPQSKAKKRSGLNAVGISFLGISFVGMLAVTAVSLYQAQQPKLAHNDAKLMAVEAQLRSLEERLTKVHDAKEQQREHASHQFLELNALLQAQQSDMEGFRISLSDRLDSEFHNIHNKVAHIKSLASQSLGEPHEAWLVAELDYVAHLAAMRLDIIRDPATTLALLEYADRRLKVADDPKYRPVRKAIAMDVASLRAVAEPDIEGMWVTLEALSEQVEKLPFKKGVPQPGAAENVESSGQDSQPIEVKELSGWRQSLNRSLVELKDLVKIRKHDQAVVTRYSFEDKQALHYQLQMMLEQIRLALVQRQSVLYQDILATANKTIDDYFDLSDVRVVSMKESLSQLADINIKPQLPDRLAIVEQVQALSKTLD